MFGVVAGQVYSADGGGRHADCWTSVHKGRTDRDAF